MGDEQLIFCPSQALRLATYAALLVFVSGCVQRGELPTIISFTTNWTMSDEFGRVSEALPSAYSGQPYAWGITPRGGTPPYTCAPSPPGSSLPGSLVFSDCAITGSAPVLSPGSVKGIYPIKFTITDAKGNAGGPFQLSLTIVPLPPNLDVPDELPTAIIGEPYVGYDFCEPPSQRSLDCGGSPPSTNPSGGTPPYTFDASGQPLGLSMGMNGRLSGKVREGYKPGNYIIKVCITDGARLRVCRETVLPVVDAATAEYALTPRIAPEHYRLPDATVGKPYSYTITAVNGTPPYTFKVGRGGLPANLQLSPDGVLSSASVGQGFTQEEFIICVSDSKNYADCSVMYLTLVIVKEPRPTSPTPPPTTTPPYTTTPPPTTTPPYTTTPPPPLDIYIQSPNDAYLGELYTSCGIFGEGGSPPYEYSAVGLPFGLKMERNYGCITGTVNPDYNVPGSNYLVEICVTDSKGQIACKRTNIKVVAR